MRRTNGPAWLLGLALGCACAAVPAGADEPAVRAGALPAPPADSARFAFFPRGDVFRPLLADPKEEGSFLSYVNGRAPVAFGTHIGSVGIGDQLGILRWRSARGERTFQASVSGNVYSQFNLATSPTGLVNADYSLGFPLAYQSGRFSSRLRFYHQSSHLGDGLLIAGRVPHEPASFESVDLVSAVTAGAVRVYGGGEYRVEGRHLEFPSWVTHWGLELRQREPVAKSGALGRARLVAGLDVKTYQKAWWDRSWSVRAGLEVARPRDVGRGWNVLVEYFEGPSPFGQFITEHISYLGIGLHLGL